MTQQTYIPEIWQVKKDYVLAAIKAIEKGIEYTSEHLKQHDFENGRADMKNKAWAETMENDINQMRGALLCLRIANSAPLENQPESE